MTHALCCTAYAKSEGLCLLATCGVLLIALLDKATTRHKSHDHMPDLNCAEVLCVAKQQLKATAAVIVYLQVGMWKVYHR